MKGGPARWAYNQQWHQPRRHHSYLLHVYCSRFRCACGLTLFDMYHRVLRYFCVVGGVGFKPRTTLEITNEKGEEWQSAGRHPWIPMRKRTGMETTFVACTTSCQPATVETALFPLPALLDVKTFSKFGHNLPRWNRSCGQIAPSHGNPKDPIYTNPAEKTTKKMPPRLAKMTPVHGSLGEAIVFAGHAQIFHFHYMESLRYSGLVNVSKLGSYVFR